MPVKRRLSKSRRFNVTPETAALWRSVGPEAIDVDAGGAGVILDEGLAAALGLPWLCAMPALHELVEALAEGAGHADQEAYR